MSDAEADVPGPYKRVAQTLLKESDRGCAILGAGLLSDALEELLRSFFRRSPTEERAIDSLFQTYAPLATFSARIQLAYALAILPRTLRDRIEAVRRMRNDFAHDWGPIDFEDPRTADRLVIIMGRLQKREDEPLPEGPGFGQGLTKEQMVRRLTFVLNIVGMTGRLRVLADLAREGRDIRRIVLAEDEQQESSGRTTRST